jgi:hypothetical protein
MVVNPNPRHRQLDAQACDWWQATAIVDLATAGADNRLMPLQLLRFATAASVAAWAAIDDASDEVIGLR